MHAAYTVNAPLPEPATASPSLSKDACARACVSVEVEVLQLRADERCSDSIEDVQNVLRVGGGGKVHKQLVRLGLFSEVQVLDKLPCSLVVPIGALGNVCVCVCVRVCVRV